MRREPPPRVAPNPRGGYDVQLPPEERELLALLPGQMLQALEKLSRPEAITPGSLRRLFPPAYPKDAIAENSYVRLVREDLIEHHREALLVLRDSSEVTHLDDAGMESWLTALTDLRLMLGTSLDVTENEFEVAPDHPDYYEWICYVYLSQLQQEVVEVLTTQLPEPSPQADEDIPDDPWGEPLGGLRWDGTPTPDEP